MTDPQPASEPDGKRRWGIRVALIVIACLVAVVGIAVFVLGDDSSDGDGSDDETSTSAETPPAEETAQAFVDAINARDCDALVELASPAFFESLGGTADDCEASIDTVVTRVVRDPDAEFSVAHVEEDGDSALAQVEVTAPSGTIAIPIELRNDDGWLVDSAGIREELLDPDAPTADGPDTTEPEDDTISIGVPEEWDDAAVASYLWKQILEDSGRTVEITSLPPEPGLIFQSMAQGDIDLYFGAWLPRSQREEVEAAGDDVKDLGAWYDGAVSTVAVPSYVGADSLDDLAGGFGGELVVPGAQGDPLVRDGVLAEYGLDDLEPTDVPFEEMLARLDDAIARKQPIAVRLWHPHWAYEKYDLTDLTDPQGLLDPPEQIHTYANAEFVKETPKVAAAIKSWEMDDALVSNLEKVALQDNDDTETGVRAWIGDNRAYVDSLAP